MLLNLNNLVEKYGLTIKGVLHIGAHFGEENGVYDHLQIPNRIFFEPLKSNFNILKDRVSDTHQLINIALGNDNKTINMNVETANSGQSSSILNPVLHLIQYPHIKFESVEEVEMKRLDDLNINLENFQFYQY